VSLAKARKQREQALEQLTDGVDPVEAQRLQAENAKAQAANTFKAAAPGMARTQETALVGEARRQGAAITR